MADNIFRCGHCGAGLGLKVKNGDGWRVAVFGRAIDLGMDHPDDVEIVGWQTGQFEFLCGICRKVTVWRASARSVVELFKKLDTSAAVEFSVMLSREHGAGF